MLLDRIICIEDWDESFYSHLKQWKKFQCQQRLSWTNGLMRFITLQPWFARKWLILSSNSLSWLLITKTSTDDSFGLINVSFLVEWSRKVSLLSPIVFDCLLRWTDQLIMKTKSMRQAIICRIQTEKHSNIFCWCQNCCWIHSKTFQFMQSFSVLKSLKTSLKWLTVAMPL